MKKAETEGETRYAWYTHMDTLDYKKGETVKGGKQVGTTGAYKKGEDHLHFSVSKEFPPGTRNRDLSTGVWENPENYIKDQLDHNQKDNR